MRTKSWRQVHERHPEHCVVLLRSLFYTKWNGWLCFYYLNRLIINTWTILDSTNNSLKNISNTNPYQSSHQCDYFIFNPRKIRFLEARWNMYLNFCKIPRDFKERLFCVGLINCITTFLCLRNLVIPLISRAFLQKFEYIFHLASKTRILRGWNIK